MIQPLAVAAALPGLTQALGRRTKMSTQAKKQLSLIGAIISVIVAVLVIPGLVGHPARLVDLISLFASGVAGGASLATAIVLSRST